MDYQFARVADPANPFYAAVGVYHIGQAGGALIEGDYKTAVGLGVLGAVEFEGRKSLGLGANNTRPSYLTSAEFTNLPIIGVIDPRTIRYSQDSAASVFKSPYGNIDDFIQGLRTGEIDPATVEPIRIIQREGKVFTLDNRRLYSFEQAGIEIPYQKLDAVPKRELFKFTTLNDGLR